MRGCAGANREQRTEICQGLISVRSCASAHILRRISVLCSLYAPAPQRTSLEQRSFLEKFLFSVLCALLGSQRTPFGALCKRIRAYTMTYRNRPRTNNGEKQEWNGQYLPNNPGSCSHAYAGIAELENTDSTLRSSRAVPHPSTNRALRRLTSEVRRDPVHSTRYGRQR